ncbi:hypothetical protein BX666DRAFT_1985419 [Dichotomocladium elegans]|nr:hypothetical protein BX666DRAFT_1985419 [Dichotomocladium elegans]
MTVGKKIKRNFKRLFHPKPTDEKESLRDNTTSANNPSRLLRHRLTDQVVRLHRKIWRKKSKVPVCGCGRPLKAGWECSVCRLSCPRCHRALMEREECSRCGAAIVQQQQSSISA